MKSAVFENLLLGHIFKQQPLASPCCIYLELLQDTSVPQRPRVLPNDVEIQALNVVGTRIKVERWTKTLPVISPGETIAAKVYNTDEIILPAPPNNEEWYVTHFGLWSGNSPEDYLLYYSAFEDTIKLDSNYNSILPGSMIIWES
jgi:hypothetical protein